MTTETTPAAGEAVTPANTTPATPSNEATPTLDTAAEPTEDQPPSQPGAEKPEQTEETKRKPSRLEAIQQLRQQRRELRSENARLREEVARLNRPLVKDVESLDYDGREKLRVREALREDRREDIQERAKELQRQDRSIEEQEVEAVHTAVFEKLTDAQDRFPGLGDKLTRINLTQDTVEYLADSDKGADLAHLLVSKPGLADELFRLTNPKTATAASLREADRVMARLEAGIAKPVARKATTAPNPGTTLNGAGAPTNLSLSELAKSDDAAAYIRQREAAWKTGKR